MMDIERLSAYLPMDRRHTLATGCPLPDRAEGAALFADIASFTPLAEALATALGPRRGVEELTWLLNAVYDGLIAQRRELHRTVADWLEANAGERIGEYLSLIAEHYELAGEKAKAAHYLDQASEQALKISAYQEALSFLTRALNLIDTLIATPSEQATAAQMKPMTLRPKVRLGETLYSLGNYLEARRLLQEAVGDARQINLQAVIATAVRVLGKVATALGDYEEARKLMWESLAIARETGDQLRIARALRNLGLVAENLGQLAEAVNYYQESLALFRVVGNQMGTAGALANLGSIAVLRGNSREAGRLFEEAHAIFGEIGFRWGVAYTLIRLGEIALDAQAYDRANVQLGEAYEMCAEIGHRWGMTMSLIRLGEATCAMCDYHSAEECFYQALQIAMDIQLVPTMLCALVGMATLFRTRGRARTYYRTADHNLHIPSVSRPRAVTVLFPTPRFRPGTYRHTGSRDRPLR